MMAEEKRSMTLGPATMLHRIVELQGESTELADELRELAELARVARARFALPSHPRDKGNGWIGGRAVVGIEPAVSETFRGSHEKSPEEATLLRRGLHFLIGEGAFRTGYSS